MTVGRALEELAARKILSAPLVAAPDLEDALDAGDTPPPDTPQLLGWIDTGAGEGWGWRREADAAVAAPPCALLIYSAGDILRAFLRHLDDALADAGAPLPSRMLELMTLLEREGGPFSRKSLITLREGADRELVFQAAAGASLLDAIKDSFLHEEEAGKKGRVVHRVAIFDARGGVTAVVSQLDVLHHLAAHQERLGELGSRTLADLGLAGGEGRPPVATVDPHTPTLLALKSMLAAGVSGAAVVQAADGVAIANLSTSDVRACQPRHLSILALVREGRRGEEREGGGTAGGDSLFSFLSSFFFRPLPPHPPHNSQWPNSWPCCTARRTRGTRRPPRNTRTTPFSRPPRPQAPAATRATTCS
jgi:CBS domain-containing protein